jgi:hypothetical protein
LVSYISKNILKFHLKPLRLTLVCIFSASSITIYGVSGLNIILPNFFPFSFPFLLFLVCYFFLGGIYILLFYIIGIYSYLSPHYIK